MVFTTGALIAAAAAGPSAGAAQPRSVACGEVTSSNGNLLRVRATNMPCSRAKTLLRRGMNSKGRVKGAPGWTISAGGCEGMLWTAAASRYQQRHGRLPRNARYARFAVTRGCHS